VSARQHSDHDRRRRALLRARARARVIPRIGAPVGPRSGRGRQRLLLKQRGGRQPRVDPALCGTRGRPCRPPARQLNWGIDASTASGRCAALTPGPLCLISGTTRRLLQLALQMPPILTCIRGLSFTSWAILTHVRTHNRHASESEAQLGAIGAERRQHGPAGVLQGAHRPTAS